MKCRECSGCYKGYWASAPEAYACVNAKEPFEIVNINDECVRHGHWNISFDGYYPYCSECGYQPDRNEDMDYCLKCGCKMDGDINA